MIMLSGHSLQFYIILGGLFSFNIISGILFYLFLFYVC